jgi:hypothetical protein
MRHGYLLVRRAVLQKGWTTSGAFVLGMLDRFDTLSM